MIPRPTTPHAGELIGDHWPEIDEVALLSVATDTATKAETAFTAETKTYADSGDYQAALPEGFENQVQAIHRVGGMAAALSGWLAKGAAETVAAATSVTTTKTMITTVVTAAEAVIAAKQAEIAMLLAAPLGPLFADMRIQQLQAEIRQTIETAKTDIHALYEGVYVPSPPIPLALKPLTFQFAPMPTSPSPTVTPGGFVPGLSSESAQSLIAESADFAITPVSFSQESVPGAANVNTPPAQPSIPTTQGSAAPPSTSVPGSAAMPQAPSVSAAGTSAPSVSAAPSMSSPATSTSAGVGSGGAPSSSAGAATSSPTSGAALGVSSGGGGASPSSAAAGSAAQPAPGAAAPGRPAASLPAAASPVAGPASLASTTSSAASSAAFRPPVESTVSSSPVQGTPASSTPGVGQQAAPSAGQVAASPAAAPTAAAGVPAAAGPAAGAAAAPLAPAPAAGVPNPAAPILPGSPAAVGTPGGSVGTPVAPPNVINTFGGHNVGAKLAQMGSRTVGAGLSATPEFTAATALTGALNDPAFGVITEWACAVFQNPGEKPRFVIASREGLSWIPAGLFMPDGVTIAHLDHTIDWAVRKRWRGLRPPARVLANYARIIGEEPRIVVARHYLGLDGLFSERTVVVADDKTVIDPNPLRDPAGRHRLELASPEGWWPQVQTIPEAEIAERIRGVASWVADTHDQAFGADPLRTAAVEHIGRSGGDHLWHEVEQRMHYVRSEIMTAPVDAPEPLSEGWNDGLVAAEQMLRGWEALWLGQRTASRETLADMTYAAVAATM